jgi:hypothetical protein
MTALVWTLWDAVNLVDWLGAHWPPLVVFGGICAAIGWRMGQ